MTAFAYYLLKVIICSGILFLYYHLALRNKLFHQWNRFYLLAAIVISLFTPIVQVSILHQTSEEPNKAIQALQVLQSADGYLEEVTIGDHQPVSTDQWLIMIYIIISAGFLISVLLSFQKIISIIKSHTIQWVDKIRFVNTNAQGTPFSFLNFIFWNEGIDIQTETGQQIFQHELVHVKEKHTLDKLFVQFILVVFWCNPFFWLIRRELKLIHEFIADQKAVGEHGAAALAAMILSSSYPSQFNSITNQFFQTSIKRRLSMLTKIQNPKINYLSRILALPILAITVLAFALRTKNISTPIVNLEKPITVVIDAGHGLMANGAYNGARNGDIYEDDITLAISNKIKELNTNDKIKIVLTRPTEQIVDLHKRVDIAKENNADLFISIHVNAAAPNQNPNEHSGKSINKGFEIYVSGKQPAYQQQSELFGSVLQQQLSSIHAMNSSLLKRNAGVWVLDQNACPSVLVECGFLTDENDREFITKNDNQTAIAQKVLEAIERYALNQPESQKSNLDTIPRKQVQVKEAILKDTSFSAQENSKKMNLKLDSQNPPLYILDGREVSKTELDKIDPSAIASINVLKDKSAINKYGKKGVNGVIEIWLKSFKSNEKVTVQEVTLKPRPSDLPLKNDGQQNPKVKVDEIILKNPGNTKVHDTIPKSEPIFTKAEKGASIDKEEWQSFLSRNLQSVIEETATKGAKPGTYIVKVKFLVKKDGSVSDFKALNDPGYGLAKKVVDMMKDSPKWNPAEQNHQLVNSYHTQPITFVIRNNN